MPKFDGSFLSTIPWVIGAKRYNLPDPAKLLAGQKVIATDSLVFRVVVLDVHTNEQHFCVPSPVFDIHTAVDLTGKEGFFGQPDGSGHLILSGPDQSQALVIESIQLLGAFQIASCFLTQLSNLIPVVAGMPIPKNSQISTDATGRAKVQTAGNPMLGFAVTAAANAGDTFLMSGCYPENAK